MCFYCPFNIHMEYGSNRCALSQRKNIYTCMYALRSLRRIIFLLFFNSLNLSQMTTHMSLCTSCWDTSIQTCSLALKLYFWNQSIFCFINIFPDIPIDFFFNFKNF